MFLWRLLESLLFVTIALIVVGVLVYTLLFTQVGLGLLILAGAFWIIHLVYRGKVDHR